MPKNKFDTKALTSSALLVAVSVLLASLFSLAPNEYSRFSIETVPIVLSGILFGPIHGALVGFAADFIGCQFSPFGYNPIFSIPPILYGITAGLFAPLLKKGVTFVKLLLTVGIPAILGSVLYQSFALDFVYGNGFLLLVSTRLLQFTVVTVVDAIVIKMLFDSNMFYRLGLWTEKKK
ncbi:MAG: folate family ECF transporter S component [Ruminococcaceae bacterium]|nr:folate family ECF transporter S component [Oscillospiraceae bacterium]